MSGKAKNAATKPATPARERKPAAVAPESFLKKRKTLEEIKASEQLLPLTQRRKPLLPAVLSSSVLRSM
jgi:hypothetical protein